MSAVRHTDPANGVHEPLVALLPALPAHAALAALRELSEDLGLHVLSAHSFPFPRRAGNLFIYNEFHVIAEVAH